LIDIIFCPRIIRLIVLHKKNKLSFKSLFYGFFQGHERTVKAKKNILASFLIKGTSVIVGFLMVRLTIDYLDTTKYGIWLTMTSFFSWFTFFEIGLGNGLRNKLAEALAKDDYELGKNYVSTAYAIISLIVGSISIVFFIANIFLRWDVILNTDNKLALELTNLAYIVFGFFFLRFVLKLIGTILYADQRPALANSFGPIGNVFILILIYILSSFTKGSLILLGTIMSVVPVIVLITASLILFNGRYKKIAPSFVYIKFKYAKDLLSLGIKFFLIQIAGLVIFQTSNIIIAQYMGPNEVATYNIAYKYFSIPMMLFSIINTPFWSAYTDAWSRHEIDWIKSINRKLLLIWGLISLFGVVLLIISPWFFQIWIGDKVQVPFSLSFWLLLYFITFTLGGVFNMFINGVGKIKIQVISSFIGAFLFILLSVIFIKYFNLGIVGLVIASIIANFNGYILTPIQYSKIINGKAKGIWNK